MLSDTIRDGLENYRIGERIRAMRLEKKLGLVELGQHTGLSPALLSRFDAVFLLKDTASKTLDGMLSEHVFSCEELKAGKSRFCF